MPDTVWTDPTQAYPAGLDRETGQNIPAALWDQLISNLNRLGGVNGNLKTGPLGINGAITVGKQLSVAGAVDIGTSAAPVSADYALIATNDYAGNTMAIRNEAAAGLSVLQFNGSAGTEKGAVGVGNASAGDYADAAFLAADAARYLKLFTSTSLGVAQERLKLDGTTGKWFLNTKVAPTLFLVFNDTSLAFAADGSVPSGTGILFGNGVALHNAAADGILAVTVATPANAVALKVVRGTDTTPTADIQRWVTAANAVLAALTATGGLTLSDDARVPNTKTYRSVDAAGTGTVPLVSADASDRAVVRGDHAFGPKAAASETIEGSGGVFRIVTALPANSHGRVTVTAAENGVANITQYCLEFISDGSTVDVKAAGGAALAGAAGATLGGTSGQLDFQVSGLNLTARGKNATAPSGVKCWLQYAGIGAAG